MPPQLEDGSAYEGPPLQQAAPAQEDGSAYEGPAPSAPEDDTDKLLSTPVPIPPTQLPSPLRFGKAFGRQELNIYQGAGGTQAIPPPPPGYADWQKYYEAHKNEPSGARLFFNALRSMAAPGATGVAAQKAVRDNWPEIKKQLPSGVGDFFNRLTGPWLEEAKQFGRDFSAQQERQAGQTPEAAGKITANVLAAIQLLYGLASGVGFGRQPGDLGRPTILPPEGRPGAPTTPPATIRPTMETTQPVAVDALGRPVQPPTTALGRPVGARVGPLQGLGRKVLGTGPFAAQDFVEKQVDANLERETLHGVGTYMARTLHEQGQNLLRTDHEKAVQQAYDNAAEENSRLLQEYDRQSDEYRKQRRALVRQTARDIIQQDQEHQLAMTDFSNRGAAARVKERFEDELTRVLPAARADARAQGNALYNAVRDRVAYDSDGTEIQFPLPEMPGVLENALSRIRGSPENIRIFNNLIEQLVEGEDEPTTLARPPEFGPPPQPVGAADFFAGIREGLSPEAARARASAFRPGTTPAQITRIADLVAAATRPQAAPMTLTWNNMQGLITELGYKIMAARNQNAPQDVPAAMGVLRDFLQAKMMQIAEARNQGRALQNAINFWANHMQFWYANRSPIKQAITLAQDGIDRTNPTARNRNAFAVAQKLLGPGVTDYIQQMAGFGRNGLRATRLAVLIRQAKQIMGTAAQQAKAPEPLVPARQRFQQALAKSRAQPPTPPTPVPAKLPKPFQPERFRGEPLTGVMRLGPEEIQRNNLIIARKHLSNLAHWGSWILPVTAWGTLEAVIHVAFGGQTLIGAGARFAGFAGAIPIFLHTREGIVNLLMDRRVIQSLTQPTSEQLRALDSIPDRYRTEAARRIKRVANVARQRGIPVNPKLINWANQMGQRRLPAIPDTRRRKREELMRQGRELTATHMEQQQQASVPPDLSAPDLQPHIPASDQAFAEIAQREGYRDTAYLDTAATPRTEQEKRDGGVWTIGFGRTEGVTAGMTTTRDVEEQWARDRAADLQDQILGLLDVGVTDQQLASLISFSYQEGITRLKNSTLLKEVNAGHKEKAADEFRKWVYSGGQRRQSIVSSRERERIPFIAGAVQ